MSRAAERALSGPEVNDPFIPGYEKAAADPRYPVIDKDDYIRWLETELSAFRKNVRKTILKLVKSYGDAL